MIELLAEVLTRAGKRVERWDSADGTSALVLEHGGRVIGLYAPNVNHNLLWTHPAFESASSTERFFRSTDWHNSGGQRTWLSPEKSFFLPNYPTTFEYYQPRQLDPGRYYLEMQREGIRLNVECVLDDLYSRSQIHVAIEKSIRGAADPLRHMSPHRANYAGITLCSQLKLLNPTNCVSRVSLWSLLQVPHGGELILPTISKASAVVYFGDIAQEDVQIEDHSVSYRMTAKGKQKLGFEAYSQTGRIGYIYQTGEGSHLVVVNCQVHPSLEYVDAPWRNPDAPACAVQVCNVNCDLGVFSELEYHSPALDPEKGRASCFDESQIWTYSGEPKAIEEAAHLLLGCSYVH